MQTLLLGEKYSDRDSPVFIINTGLSLYFMHSGNELSSTYKQNNPQEEARAYFLNTALALEEMTSPGLLEELASDHFCSSAAQSRMRSSSVHIS
jgi:hypothetical protein